MPQGQMTPSPHRFLATQRKSKPSSKRPQPASWLRQEPCDPEDPEQGPPQQQQQTQPTQFAQLPRFSHGKAKVVPTSERPRSPPKSALIQAFRASGRPLDDVEDSDPAYGNEDEDMLDDAVQARPSIEYNHSGTNHDEQWSNNLAFSPKRRRLQATEEATLSPAAGAFKYPTTPASHLAKQTPRSTLSTQTSAAESSATPRPAFLRASVQPQEPTEPVPEVFSPHKRGQKFAPGGMAATMQQWVLETGQAAVQSRKGQGYLNGENYVMKFRVDEVVGEGPLCVRGRLHGGESLNVLLPKRGNESQDKTSAGNVVGLRAPTWEIELNGQIWTVGVDWRML